MAKAGLSLGSNLGDKAGSIASALRLLDEATGIRVLRRSRLYRTEPWGDPDQDWFLNACALVETSLSPHGLLGACLDIETKLGRDRTTSRRWGPRPIDLDVLFYGQEQIAEADLVLPHPHMFERAFVLVPLSEVAGDVEVSGRRIREAAEEIDASSVSVWDRA